MDMNFIDDIRRQLDEMGIVERHQAIESLREVIYEDAYIQSRPVFTDAVACPRCDSVTVVRKGHDHDGVQRWLCRDCGRTFSNRLDTIISRSKLKPPLGCCIWSASWTVCPCVNARNDAMYRYVPRG